MNKVDTYVGNGLGDFVRCNNCGAVMLVPCGTDICPDCDTEGCLSWVDENRQEQRLSELLNTGYTVGRIATPELDTLESILESCDKCERFAEIVLDEISSDEEQPRHIGSNIIKAYLDGDCDNLLIALCGWSMDSLLEKYNKASSSLKICPECQEQALRYAMIDVDGTNLEEGYSCGECGECFIGLDNEQVIETNPEMRN